MTANLTAAAVMTVNLTAQVMTVILDQNITTVKANQTYSMPAAEPEDRAQVHQIIDTQPLIALLIQALDFSARMICTQPMKGARVGVTWLTCAINCLSDPPMIC